MKGYLGRDDLTRAAFIDGWYNTDTFAGNKTHTGLTLKNFEVFI